MLFPYNVILLFTRFIKHVTGILKQANNNRNNGNILFENCSRDLEITSIEACMVCIILYVSEYVYAS